MSRGKTISDLDLRDRLMAVLMEQGPAELTFTKAAATVGLAPATLVQRFGTRAGMVEATLLHAWDRLHQATAVADAEARLDPEGAVELLLRLTKSGNADYDFTDGLLLLREDMRNALLRSRGADWGMQLAHALGRRLCDDPDRALRLGWQMASLWQGALIWWAFRRDGQPHEKVRDVLNDWLQSIGQQS